jgi:hypothetical protein
MNELCVRSQDGFLGVGVLKTWNYDETAAD